MNRCHPYKPIDPKIVCEVGELGIQIEGAKRVEDANLIADSFHALPHSFRIRFGFASNFKILEPDAFASTKPQSNSGIKFDGKTWYFNSRLFEPSTRKSISDRVVVAVGTIVAQEMDGTDGFDSLTFVRVFRKYVRQEYGSFPEERIYYSYLSQLSRLNQLDATTLQHVFQKLRQEEDRLHRTDFSINLPPQLNPWVIHSAYQRFVQDGYKWRVASNDVVVLNLQSLNDMEKLGSSHRLNLYYYSTLVNDQLGVAANTISPKIRSRVLWAPGIMGSYEQWDLSKGKEVRVIVGSQLDVGLTPEGGGLFLHSYVGWPVRIMGGETGALRPEWELGLRYTGLGGSLFIGSTFSSALYDLQPQYFGALLRWRG